MQAGSRAGWMMGPLMRPYWMEGPSIQPVAAT